jgi:hypothetical protein
MDIRGILFYKKALKYSFTEIYELLKTPQKFGRFL